VNNLGTVYYADKSYRRAVGQYKKALRLSPKSATIFSNLGSAYFSRHDYKRAIECYNTAFSLDPEVFDHHGTTGVLLQESTVDDRATFHYYMARVYARNGSVDHALQYIRKALEEGFRDRRKFRDDPDFASLQKLPEFQQLMSAEPRVL
jgi:pentatricopeptide repeat protein